MYTMILADGTQITNLELNGNNYISNEIIDQSVFDGNLSTLTIADGETEKTYSDMKLVSLRVVDNQTWIIVAPKTEEDKRQERIAALEAQLAAYEAAYAQGVNEA